ncbi:uncharacterized protein I303_106724 [Kwoniella dejecticola CBS 10117]|uniref:Uncharacterized protein n=1 Tax=Kwoniella dejecticola CBS 10117 TaxID=1296121 RepID=A0AAJ8MJ54_9TREE
MAGTTHELSKARIRHFLLASHGILAAIILTLSALIYTDRLFVPSLISAVAADVYIPTTVYLAWQDPGNGLLTVGREVCYLLAQGLIVLILGIMSALSSKDDICSAPPPAPSPFTDETEFASAIESSEGNNALTCREKVAVSVLSFMHLVIILSWLALLFLSVHRHRGHKKPSEADAFDMAIHRFMSHHTHASRFSGPEDIEGDSTPIQTLTKNGSPISPGNGLPSAKEVKRPSTSSGGGSIPSPHNQEGTIHDVNLNDDDEDDHNNVGDQSDRKQNRKHQSTSSGPWRISSLPLPDFKFHLGLDSARNSAKSSQSQSQSQGALPSFSFSNYNPRNSKKPSPLNTSPGGGVLLTLESARNSIKSWRRGDDGVGADLESMRRDHKRIESWRISPIPLPDLNLGFDTRSTKSNNRNDTRLVQPGNNHENDNHDINTNDGSRNSMKSQLSGLTLDEVRNSIQSTKSKQTRDSLKSQFSYHAQPQIRGGKRESLEPPPVTKGNTGGYRSTFQFRPELEVHRDSMETL